VIDEVGRLFLSADVIELAGYAVLDAIAVKGPEHWDQDAEDAAFDARQRRSRRLQELQSERVIPVGLALLDRAGEPSPRAAVAVVTPDDLVVLDADAVSDPETELARIPRASVARVRVVDGSGREIAPSASDVMQLNPEPCALVVDLEGGGSVAFGFRSTSVAHDALAALTGHLGGDVTP
jgi:hypothetical protein